MLFKQFFGLEMPAGNSESADGAAAHKHHFLLHLSLRYLQVEFPLVVQPALNLVGEGGVFCRFGLLFYLNDFLEGGVAGALLLVRFD